MGDILIHHVKHNKLSLCSSFVYWLNLQIVYLYMLTWWQTYSCQLKMLLPLQCFGKTNLVALESWCYCFSNKIFICFSVSKVSSFWQLVGNCFLFITFFALAYNIYARNLSPNEVLLHVTSLFSLAVFTIVCFPWNFGNLIMYVEGKYFW